MLAPQNTHVGIAHSTHVVPLVEFAHHQTLLHEHLFELQLHCIDDVQMLCWQVWEHGDGGFEHRVFTRFRREQGGERVECLQALELQLGQLLLSQEVIGNTCIWFPFISFSRN